MGETTTRRAGSQKLLAYDATISSVHPKNSKLKGDLNLQSLGFETSALAL